VLVAFIMAAFHVSSFTLNNGNTIPAVGLGTWNSTKEGEVKNSVLTAIRAGYRHIDCAWCYKNEKEIGVALKEAVDSGLVRREELFITSKLWNDFHASNDVEKQCRETLTDLQLTYLDLFLIHWPHTFVEGEELSPPIQETWLAMEALVAQGLVKSIGVSNFSAKKLHAMKAYATIFPAVNQCELHPVWRQSELLATCTELGVHMTAYSPLGTPDFLASVGRTTAATVINQPAVLEIAAETGKSPAQVVIRWAVQRGTSVIPKSATPERIISNLDVFTWSLTADQLARLSAIEPQSRLIDGTFFVSPNGPYKTTAALWDE